jgi:hypothetical protein
MVGTSPTMTIRATSERITRQKSTLDGVALELGAAMGSAPCLPGCARAAEALAPHQPVNVANISWIAFI